MTKPTVTLRKPPEPVPSANIETFVRGERSNVQVVKNLDAQALKRLDVQVSECSKAVVKRTDGRELRRMTVYLPTDLAARLRVYCAEMDIDVSAFISEIVANRLDT